MKLNIGQFATIDWTQVEPKTYPGEEGVAIWRTVERGEARIRMVEYSPGYIADHWCEKGHVILVLKGELETELKDGRKSILSEGMCYTVSDAGEAHRSISRGGATLFIVD
jgi:quercetin dioxygenase-like cupin family protein